MRILGSCGLSVYFEGESVPLLSLSPHHEHTTHVEMTMAAKRQILSRDTFGTLGHRISTARTHAEDVQQGVLEGERYNSVSVPVPV